MSLHTNLPSFRRTLPSLGTLLDALGQSTLRLVSDEAARDLAITQTVLHDPGCPVPEAHRGLLLGVGLKPDGEGLHEVLADAATAGYAAVAVKRHGREVTLGARAADSVGIALLVVDDDVEWLQLDRLVETALSGTGAGADAVMSSLAVGDLFSLANVIAAATGGATAIEDLSRRVLAYSAVGGQRIDAERQEGILGRQVPDLPLNDEQYARLYRAPGVVGYPATDTGLGRLAVAVRSGSEPLGSVWIVVPEGGLRPDAEQVVASASEIAALHLLRNRSSHDATRQRRTDLVRRLLEHDDPAAARQLNVTDPGRLCVVAIQPSEKGSPVSSPTRSAAATPSVDVGRLLDVVTLELEARLGPTGCVDSAGRVYAVVAIRESPERTRAAIEGAVRGIGHALHTSLACGISRPLRAAWRVSLAREDADRVVDLVLVGATPGPVASASSLVDSLRLLSLADQLPDPAELSETAAAILAYDVTHGTDHADLLLSWLESRGDTRTVAQQLGVHVNTVRYRLGRLEEVHGLDRSDPDQLLLLWLALRLRRHGRPT
ncbi:MAG: helix-turn-helix domain-containing protein [Ornithinimicrobium sp.]|uniref:PucR family transcriptional regulator n=1 Tax=Ornithinimicrobium sp. TaxID=1977084 RepID=UPI0026E048E3|nr:PucR family transcriptional regulator [Ornithinimicrobium sp.]MDO5738807.1 helix-turn-helix domain-containing protein [Ornithinimicrobium sp.]